MFSLKIVSSDAFLDMPQSSQNLYFHLGMNADDDGFVNPRRIMRMLGASEDDVKVLLSKRFLLPFESGVVVIKHWLIHNSIRGDRYTETDYKKEKASLLLNDWGAYTDRKDGTAIKEVKKIEKPKWQEKRNKAMTESSLPYSFGYKIVQAFYGKPCPICETEMRDVPEDEMDYSSRISPRPSIQHNIPISKGGRHELGNISVICQSCNYSTQDNETGELNAKEVEEVWRSIGNQSAPQERIGLGKERKEEPLVDDFEQFWKLFPSRRKGGKKTPKLRWDKLSDETKQLILQDLPVRVAKHKDWLKNNGDFIPAPEVYLNKEQWLMPIIEAPVEVKTSAQKVDRFPSKN